MKRNRKKNHIKEEPQNLREKALRLGSSVVVVRKTYRDRVSDHVCATREELMDILRDDSSMGGAIVSRSIPTRHDEVISMQIVGGGDGVFLGVERAKSRLRTRETKIKQNDVLLAWGVDRSGETFSCSPNDSVFESLGFDPKLKVIDIKEPPKEEEFYSLWEKWSKASIPDTVVTLFHGTWADNVGPILSRGFRLPSGRGQAFGKGIYFGEWNKAMGYSYPSWSLGRHSRLSSLRFIIEAYVLLGKVYTTYEALHNNARKLMEQNGCQSILCKGFRNPEWIVYNPHQILIRRVHRLSAD